MTCECGCGEQPNPGKRFINGHATRLPRRKRFTVEERFWQKVDKTDDCWNWTASLQGAYGQFFNGDRLVLAHRWSYEHAKGTIPEGLQVDHLCRNRLCVNPDHLEAVTCRENLVRGTGFVAKQVAQTHCLRGHPLSGDNLIVSKKGKRHCRACARIHDANRRPRSPRGTDASQLPDAA